MRSPLKALLITGSLVATILGAALPATAAPAGAHAKPSLSPSATPTPSPTPSPPAAPTLDTTHFACGNGVCGTRTTAGTYAFTVQITASNTNGPYGPSATQQLTITIGTGSSDRPAGIGAGWNIHTETLGLAGWDANISALWSVSVTSTGRVLFSNLPSRTTYPIDGFLVVQIHSGYPCPFGGCDLTVTNNLGSSVTVFLGPPKY